MTNCSPSWWPISLFSTIQTDLQILHKRSELIINSLVKHKNERSTNTNTKMPRSHLSPLCPLALDLRFCTKPTTVDKKCVTIFFQSSWWVFIFEFYFRRPSHQNVKGIAWYVCICARWSTHLLKIWQLCSMFMRVSCKHIFCDFNS